MDKLFVSFVIAQLLKDKGFNLPCFTVFNSETELYAPWRNPSYDASLGAETSPVRNSDTKLICAPLWQQAVDWLREKKQIHITTIESDGVYTFQVKQYVNGVSNVCYVPSAGHYYTGLNQAIITGINLIP